MDNRRCHSPWSLPGHYDSNSVARSVVVRTSTGEYTQPTHPYPLKLLPVLAILEVEIVSALKYKFTSVPVPYKNLETRSEHRKILPISDLVQTWCMFRLDMDMSESGLRQVWIPSQKQICSRPDSELGHVIQTTW